MEGEDQGEGGSPIEKPKEAAGDDEGRPTTSEPREDERGQDETQSLLDSQSNQESTKTGTTFTAIVYIVTALIGSGVLSLAWSLAQLDWIAGIAFMLLIAALTHFQSTVLADCYRSSSNPENDANHRPIRTYMDAVRENLGVTAGWVCVCIQQAYMVGTAVAYNITSAASMSELWKSFGFQSNGVTPSLLMFGAAQIILSHIQDFHNTRILTYVAAIMSIFYTFIGLALSSLATFKVIDVSATRKMPVRRFGGIYMGSSSPKVWLIAQGLGDILFAYPFTTILFEIQDTLIPPENVRMKRASAISLSFTTFFYLLSSCLGYAAFGKDTKGNILAEFSSMKPNWSIQLANACVVIHLTGGYQMFSQTVFACIEGLLREHYPTSEFITRSHIINLHYWSPISINWLRVTFRTLYVAATIGMAIAFPDFNAILGVVGSFSFWVLGIYFPFQIYFAQKNVVAWTRKWVAFWILSGAILLLCLFTLVGSIAGSL